MLLDGRIFKSGYNSTSTDLVDQAYLRTGKSSVCVTSGTRDFRDTNKSDVAKMSAKTLHTASFCFFFSICPGRSLIIDKLDTF